MTFFMSCTSWDDRQLISPEVYKELSINATLSEEESFNILEGSSFTFIGNSNCNLADNTCISISGVVRNLQNGNYEIKNGNFRIMSEDTGCYLTGDFQGCGKNFSDGTTFMSAVVNVQCGTGLLQADGGELDLRMTGIDPNGNYLAEIHGQLKSQAVAVVNNQ